MSGKAQRQPCMCPPHHGLLFFPVTRLKEKDNLRERLADAEDRGIPFLIFFGDQELAKARPARAAPCCCLQGPDLPGSSLLCHAQGQGSTLAHACFLHGRWERSSGEGVACGASQLSAPRSLASVHCAARAKQRFGMTASCEASGTARAGPARGQPDRDARAQGDARGRGAARRPGCRAAASPGRARPAGPAHAAARRCWALLGLHFRARVQPTRESWSCRQVRRALSCRDDPCSVPVACLSDGKLGSVTIGVR